MSVVSVRKWRRPAPLLLAAFASSGLVRASTIVVGGNVINQTWTPAGSPYIVQGDVTVPAGAFLAIQAGTTVQFASTDGQASGIDVLRVELTVKGTLTVSGTPASPVDFQAQTGTAAGTWFGIVVDASAASAALTGATVRHAIAGVRSSGAGASLAVTDCTFSGNSYGLDLRAGTPAVSGTLVASNVNTGVYLSSTAAASLTNCVVRSNGTDGVFVIRSGGGAGTTSLLNCTIHANGSYGLRADSTSGSTSNVTLKNSIVTQHPGYGVHRGSGGGTTTVTTTYSDVWGNASNFFNASAGTGVIASNPLYAGAPSNLRLTSNSPARFGADTGGDMGALPYVSDATPGLHGTLWTSTTLPASGSPYTVAGDLTVAPGVTLAVQPGVSLRFATSDLMAANNDATRVELVVAGRLDASGSTLAPIAFTSPGAAVTSWYGVTFRPGSSGSTIAYATIDKALYGIRHETTGNHALHDLTISGCSYGVYATAGALALDATTVSSSAQSGIFLGGGAGGSITNAVVRGNTSHGIHVSASGGANSALALTNVTVHANASCGLLVEALTGSSTSVTVRNAIVTQNGYGLQRSISGGTTAVSVSHSDVWSNSFANFVNVVAGAGMLSANPLYVLAPTDLRLQSGSVCIDAGNASGAPLRDRDGNLRPLDGDGILGPAFDMGAYEFPALGCCYQVAYCTAGTTSHGCNATISATNCPSLSVAQCVISVQHVEGAQAGIVFYGLAPNFDPWGLGTSFQCVKAPFERTGTQSSGGTPGGCDGSLTLDWDAFQSAHPTALGNPWSAGAHVYLQGWFRDPPAPKTTNLSNALELSICP